MNQLIETGRRTFLSSGMALAASVVCAPICLGAGETASAEEQDLAAVQGTWVRKAGADAYGDVRRATKEINGSHEVVHFYDAGGTLLRAHQVDFKLGSRGDVKIFTYFNWEAIAGPDKGLKVAAPTSYIYRADPHTFVEVWGFLQGQEKRAPRLMIWVKKPAEAAGAHDELQGTWAVESQEDGSKPWAYLKGAELTFSGEDFAIRRQGRPFYSGVFHVDASKNPKAIDLIVTESPNDQDNARTFQGIYEINGTELRWCTAAPAVEARPTEFAIKPGSHDTLVLCRRANS